MERLGQAVGALVAGDEAVIRDRVAVLQPAGQGRSEVPRDVAKVAELRVGSIALGADPGRPVVRRRRRRVGGDPAAERIDPRRLVEVAVDDEAAAAHACRRGGPRTSRPPRRRDRGSSTRRGAIVTVRDAPIGERQGPAEQHPEALVDALEAGLGVRDRLDRRPPDLGRLGQRGRDRDPDRSRCPARMRVDVARRPAGVVGRSRVPSDFPPGRRVAAAAEHRQRPLEPEHGLDRPLGSVLRS